MKQSHSPIPTPLPGRAPACYRKIRVLAVDDEPVFTDVIKAELEDTGEFEVFTSQSPAAAMREINQIQPDFICLDICMPEFDGGDVLAWLRENPSLASIPVVMVSSLISSSEVGEHGVAINGGQAMMPKPVNATHLISYVKECLFGPAAAPVPQRREMVQLPA